MWSKKRKLPRYFVSLTLLSVSEPKGEKEREEGKKGEGGGGETSVAVLPFVVLRRTESETC